MGRHAEWVEVRHALSEASKTVHYWNTMPVDLRSQMGVALYLQKRAAARQRLKQVDRLCREASTRNRVAMRLDNRA